MTKSMWSSLTFGTIWYSFRLGFLPFQHFVTFYSKPQHSRIMWIRSFSQHADYWDSHSKPICCMENPNSINLSSDLIRFAVNDVIVWNLHIKKYIFSSFVLLLIFCRCQESSLEIDLWWSRGNDWVSNKSDSYHNAESFSANHRATIYFPVIFSIHSHRLL